MTYFLGESGGSYLARGRRLGRGRLGSGVEQSSKDWVWPLEEVEIKEEQSSTRSAGEALQRRETICLHRYVVTRFCIFLQCTRLSKSGESRLHHWSRPGGLCSIPR